jgi:hypothetical protein
VKKSHISHKVSQEGHIIFYSQPHKLGEEGHVKFHNHTLTHVNGTVTIELKPWNLRGIKNMERNLSKQNTANFPGNVQHLPRQRIVRMVFQSYSFHRTQMEDKDTNPEVCLSGEECNDYLYVCRENGWPHTIIGLMHADPSPYNKSVIEGYSYWILYLITSGQGI